MEIKLDQQQMDKAVAENVTRAISNVLAGHQMQEAIGEMIAQELTSGIISKAILESFKLLDTSALTNNLAREIQRTATAATVSILQDSFVGVIARVRGYKEFENDYQSKLEKIRAEIKGKPTS